MIFFLSEPHHSFLLIGDFMWLLDILIVPKRSVGYEKNIQNYFSVFSELYFRLCTSCLCINYMNIQIYLQSGMLP